MGRYGAAQTFYGHPSQHTQHAKDQPAQDDPQGLRGAEVREILNAAHGFNKGGPNPELVQPAEERLLVVLIGFCFGAFLEGAAGFGAPVAITAALLVGLGLNPLYAAGLCLIANTAPVAFGALGIPITVAGSLTGIPAHTIGQVAGRQLPLLALFVPFTYLQAYVVPGMIPQP